MIEVNGLSVRYGKTEALRKVALNFPVGRIVGLVGPNGAGKSTLLQVIAGLLCPQEGNVLIDGKAPGPDTKRKMAYMGDFCRVILG